MAKHSVSLVLAIVLASTLFILTMVLSALAAPGIHPFLSSTRNISDEFVTQITPSGWTFAIWPIIYTFLALVLVYLISGIFRKNAYGYVYCSPAVVPHGFFGAWCLNLALNLGWLFLWDRKFILENFVIEKHVRFILSIYPAVTWALAGVFTKNYNAASATRNNTFIGLYTTTTANVSAVFDTQLTPSGWTFNIWSVIYVWLTAMIIYIVAGLCRKNGYGYVYCSPAVLPYGFFISWCLNLCFNIGWLLVWDRGLMIPALVFLILVICTNYTMICFICHGLHIYGAWLKKYHKADLWLLRVVVQNGVMIYTTWTTIATLINLTIVLTYEAKVSATDAATISYSILAVLLLVWFVLENSVLDKHVRYICITYPVMIWALSGNLDKNYDDKSPSRNGIFIAVLLALASVLFVTRLILVLWRHVKQPLYEDASPAAMEPREIAQKQKKIYC
ncbi:uncharacterized protein LOC114453585 [Parambassis ranga]|uniref:Uncharacterized protein LOC114453585 n=1 Tax=Parambassis ranga TaxID=210632 RepID=A0A6P7KI93_9TELE|nr:uncharacterized protein LOC114453585 [Parambassis ranga]